MDAPQQMNARCIAVVETKAPLPKSVTIGLDGAVYVGCCRRQGGLERLVWRAGSLASDWFVESGKVCGAAVAADGRIFATVHDPDGPCVRVFNPDGCVVDEWGRDGEGRLRNPQGLARGPAGCLYVVEANHWGGDTHADLNGVLRFGPDGAFLGRWGETGTSPGHLNLPVGIAVDAHGDLCIADSYNCRLQFFSSDGECLRVWGRLGERSGEFNCPQGVAIDADQRVYVADTLSNRIQILGADGASLGQWGGQGSATGQFWLPCGIAVDGQGRAFVVDTLNRRIQVFELELLK